MGEIDMVELLTAALYSYDEENEVYDESIVKNIKTFEEAMVLTSNKGLVIKLEDGTEFQVTVVKSR